MVRTQVQLTEDQARRIKAVARKKRVSQAEVIRGFVDRMLPLEEMPDDAEVRRRAIEAAGRIRSGKGDLASRHDEYSAEAYRD